LRIEDSFIVPTDKDVLWNTFQDVGNVVKHIPGATLHGGAGDGPYDGEIAVAFGPRLVKFRGTLMYARDPTECRGVISGSGKDPRGNSRATVKSVFQLSEAGDAGQFTQVKIVADIDFSGPLAEFGYTGGPHVTRALIKDFATSVAQEYKPVEPTLSHSVQPPPLSRAPLSAYRLAVAIVGAWIKRLLGRAP